MFLHDYIVAVCLVIDLVYLHNICAYIYIYIYILHDTNTVVIILINYCLHL